MKTVAQIIAEELKRQAEEGKELPYVHIRDDGDLTDVCIDGYFDLEKLAEVVEQAIHERDNPLPKEGEGVTYGTVELKGMVIRSDIAPAVMAALAKEDKQ